MDGKDPEVPHPKPKGDTAFRGLSLLTSCAVIIILFFVCPLLYILQCHPFPPPLSPPPPSPPAHPGTTTLYPQTPTSWPSTAPIKPSPSQVERISSWRLIPKPTKTRSFAATRYPRRTDWASLISLPTGGFWGTSLRMFGRDRKVTPRCGSRSLSNLYKGGGFRMTSMIGDVSSALRLVEETGKRSLRLCCFFFPC